MEESGSNFQVGLHLQYDAVTLVSSDATTYIPTLIPFKFQITKVSFCYPEFYRNASQPAQLSVKELTFQ